MQTRVFSGNMMMPIVTAVYCAIFITTRLSSIEAFSNAKPFLADQPTAAGNIIFPRQLAQPKSTSLFAEKKKKKVGGLDENVRNKLVSESIAPWRTLRLFFYFSLGSGALIGGFIALTGTLAAISNGQADAEDFDMNAQVNSSITWWNFFFSKKVRNVPFGVYWRFLFCFVSAFHLFVVFKFSDRFWRRITLWSSGKVWFW